MFGPPVVQHVVIVSSLFTALSFIIVCLRLYTRSRIVRIVSVEDYLIIVALIAAIGFLTVEILQVKFGLGQHIGDVPAEHLTKFLQCLWAIIPVHDHLDSIVPHYPLCFELMDTDWEFLIPRENEDEG
ncbi:hypothetical protein SBRCBS47491_004492 [Sporothrix bragantina]|uniref:Rhodopsin domain-containing protein n=1 Tax=Sporothrix bragantina TaxID=671064 RepID=A0ABP0BNW4_9PEZI